MEHVPLWDPAFPDPDGEEYEFSDASFAFPNDDLQMSFIRAVTNVSHETDDCAADAAYMCDSVEVFDMTYSDMDDIWSCAPDLISHVRAFESLGGDADLDIILDSGADGSALPLAYGHLGHQASTSGDMYFVDAQGEPIDVRNRRTATIICNGISLEEDFIVASVTSPLVSLGRLMRMGWHLTTDEHGMNLVRGSDRIAVGLKRNSLCIRGAIRVLQRPEGQSTPLRVITLTPTLSGMRWSWQKLGPQCFGIRTNKPFHVDVTMAPSEMLLWYRTTLVKRNGAWDVEEANQLVSALDSLTTPLVAPSTVEEVLTWTCS